MKQRIPNFDDFNIYEGKKTEVEYQSKIDKNYTVSIVYPDSDMYWQIEMIIPGEGLAVTDVRQKMMVLDGGKIDRQKLTKDHILAIEMHEIMHHWLKHKGKFGIVEQEKEADYASIIWGEKNGFIKPAKILRNHSIIHTPVVIARIT